MDMASVASAAPIFGRPKRRLSSRNTNASGYGAAVANGAYATVANIYEIDRAQDEEKQLVFCASGWHCPIERSKNPNDPEGCKGHVSRKFIKECWHKCGCSMGCGNRVIQRGITRKLQGWSLRTLEQLPAGAFVCEYVGEILTNMEQEERNNNAKADPTVTHTYPILLDGD
ncbi:hypothetical protein R1sor_013179 [Riccia sorocarpa]|uniref:Uncharacterized protein n=1 Tax=Riccia sorocarpa TaxID=122646 RepID=A0ABD3H9D5_9MARC